MTEQKPHTSAARREASRGNLRAVSTRLMASAHLAENVSKSNVLATPHGATLTVQSHAALLQHHNRSVYASRLHIAPQTMEKMILRKRDPGKGPEDKGVPITYDEALVETGFGWFTFWLLMACGMVFFSCSTSTTALSFILPAAACYLDISLADRGIISASPLFGMVLGTFIWGSLSDIRGRKYVLVICITLDLVATIISGFSHHKWMLCACRIVNGFGCIGSTSLVFAYMGEFIQPNRRDILLSSLEIFWDLGMMFVPAVGWLVLPMRFEWCLGPFCVRPWNLFVLCLCLPNLLVLLLLLPLPESPRFLLQTGKLAGCLHVLQKIYNTNSRKHAQPYPVTILIGSLEAKTFFMPENADQRLTCWQGFTSYLKGLYSAHKKLFKKYKRRIAQTCLIDSTLNIAYFPFVLWVPELLYRHDIYRDLHQQSHASLCKTAMEVSHSLHEDIKTDCPTPIDEEIYFHTLIICTSCIPTTIGMYFALMYINKRVLLVACMIVAGSALIAFTLVERPLEQLVASCLIDAFCSLVETLLFCCIVELFPVEVRGTALALTVTTGRIGAILGNVYISLLLAEHCYISMFTFSASLFAGAVVCATLRLRPGHGGGHG